MKLGGEISKAMMNDEMRIPNSFLAMICLRILPEDTIASTGYLTTALYHCHCLSFNRGDMKSVEAFVT